MDENSLAEKLNNATLSKGIVIAHMFRVRHSCFASNLQNTRKRYSIKNAGEIRR